MAGDGLLVFDISVDTFVTPFETRIESRENLKSILAISRFQENFIKYPQDDQFVKCLLSTNSWVSSRAYRNLVFKILKTKFSSTWNDKLFNSCAELEVVCWCWTTFSISVLHFKRRESEALKKKRFEWWSLGEETFRIFGKIIKICKSIFQIKHKFFAFRMIFFQFNEFYFKLSAHFRFYQFDLRQGDWQCFQSLLKLSSVF